MSVNEDGNVLEVLYQELNAWPTLPKDDFERILSDVLSISGEVRKFIGHEVAVARLFYGLLVACPEVYGCHASGTLGDVGDLESHQGIPDWVGLSLVTLFDNIANVLNDGQAEALGALSAGQGESFLRVMGLLKSLREQARSGCSTPFIGQGLEDVPASLLGMLADIDYLFDIEVEGKIAFPIHSVLADFIKRIANQGVFSKFQDKDVRLLQLAVRLFREGETYELIDELKTKCNLRFIDFLQPGCEVIDTDEFDSFRANDVMVFWNSREHTVLVRSGNESYLDGKALGLPMSKCCHEGVQREKNTNGNELYAFAVWDWGEGARPTSADEVVDQEGGAETLLRLLFDDDARNVLIKRSLVALPDGTVHAINPWCPNDGRIVRPFAHGGAKPFPRDRVTDAFDSYRILPVRQSVVTPLNYVSMGLCMRLLEVENVTVDGLGLRGLTEDSWYQAQIVSSWMTYGHATNVTGRVLQEWERQIDYRSVQGRSSGKFSNEPFHAVDFLPVRHGFSSLYVALVPELGHDPLFSSSFQLHKGTWAENDGDGSLQTSDVLAADSEEKRRWIMTPVHHSAVSDSGGYLDDIQEGDEVFFLYSSTHDRGFVVSPGLSRLVWNIGLIDGGKYSLDYSVARRVDEVRHKKVLERAAMFSKAFIEKSGGCHVAGSGLEMVLDLRLLHNMLWAQLTEVSVDDYLNAIRFHEILDFPDFAGDEVIWGSNEGVLLVPKDGRRAASTLRELVDESRPSASRYHDLYECDHLVHEVSDEGIGPYFIQGQSQPVSEIILVTDNILSGRSTSNALVAYFGSDGRYEPSSDKERNYIEAAKARALSYLDLRSGIINLLDVMKANGIRKVRVHAYYATEEGIGVVARRLEQLGLGNRSDISWNKTIGRRDIEPLRGYVRAVWPERSKCPPYPVIRKFNMPGQSVFYDEMLTHPERFICLFVRKDEVVR